MKRFASHYLLIPAVGFMKQQVVEITGEGIVRDVFPLTEEIESVEWMPGVIVLLSESQYKLLGTDYADYTVQQMKKTCNPHNPYLNIFSQLNLPNASNQSSQCLMEYLHEAERKGEALFPYLFYPFDFTSMQPVDGTRHRLLR